MSEADILRAALQRISNNRNNKNWRKPEICDEADRALAHVRTEPQSLPVKLTGEIACILEDCSPPDKQTPEAVAALIEGYQPTWDRIRSALTRSQADSASVREVELEEALKNLMGIYDTPVSRRRYPQDQFMKEALDIARAALTRPLRPDEPAMPSQERK